MTINVAECFICQWRSQHYQDPADAGRALLKHSIEFHTQREGSRGYWIHGSVTTIERETDGSVR